MDRRTFIKTTVVGGTAATAFGFSLASVRAQTQALAVYNAARLNLAASLGRAETFRW